MVPKAKLCVLQVALPELLTRYWTAVRYEKKNPAEESGTNVQDGCQTQTSINSPLCHCNGLVNIPNDNSSIVECANLSCLVKRYHKFCLESLGKKRFSSKWECDDCKYVKEVQNKENKRPKTTNNLTSISKTSKSNQNS